MDLPVLSLSASGYFLIFLHPSAILSCFDPFQEHFHIGTCHQIVSLNTPSLTIACPIMEYRRFHGHVPSERTSRALHGVLAGPDDIGWSKSRVFDLHLQLLLNKLRYRHISSFISLIFAGVEAPPPPLQSSTSRRNNSGFVPSCSGVDQLSSFLFPLLDDVPSRKDANWWAWPTTRDKRQGGDE